MKKKSFLIFLMIFILNSLFSQEIQWIVNEDTWFFSYINSFEKKPMLIEKGDIIKPDKMCYYEHEKNRYVYVLYKDQIGEIDIDKVTLSNKNSDKIISINKETIILPYYNFNILSKKNRKIFKDLFEDDFKSLGGEYYSEQESYEYLLRKTYKQFLFIKNVIIDVQTNNEQSCILFIDTINKIKNGYKCNGYLKYELHNWNGKSIPFITTPTKGPHTLLILFDGDYINVYEDTKDKLLMTYAITDEKTYNEFNNLILTGKCDLSKVTWPRHADGTSPYDNQKKPAKFNFENLSTTKEVSTDSTTNVGGK